MSLAQYRQRAEQFIAALAEDEYRELVGAGRRHRRGERYSMAGDLFSLTRVAELQRALAEASGVEERRTRSLLAFAGKGYALMRAAESVDALDDWRRAAHSTPFGEIQPRSLRLLLVFRRDPAERRALTDAALDLFAANEYLVEEFIVRHRDGLAELGYGGHVATFQLLTGVDIGSLAREARSFLRDTQSLYSDLLTWQLPKMGVDPSAPVEADALRLEAGVEWSRYLAGGDGYRAVLGYLASIGVDPATDGRVRIAWDLPLERGWGALCLAPHVPEQVHLLVGFTEGRSSWSSFLIGLGTALHGGYTDPTLPLEERQLGDASAMLATGHLFAGLLRNPAFLTRTFGMSRDTVREFQRFEALAELSDLRRQIGRLLYAIDFYDGAADSGAYADIVSDATGFRHDPREALWEVDVELECVWQLRAAALAAVHEEVLRDRFDEDWFRNPAAGGYLRDLFANGRRHTADELARQLGARSLTLAGIRLDD